MKILTVFGTRPEAIKLAPVLRQIAASPAAIESVVCVTGQHRQMLDQILDLFGIRPQHDLDIMLDGQDLFDISVRTLAGMRRVLTAERPDVVLVQGDTTSAFLAALSSFYLQIPVGHVEAGLRTGNHYDPFPEEMNRTLITQVATEHFAPTVRAQDNVLAAGVDPARVHLTGNTVVDAIRAVLAMPAPPLPAELRSLHLDRRRLVVVTSHRRESFGMPMRSVFAAIRDVLARHADVVVAFPVHLNPNVRAAAADTLGAHERLVLLDPLPYDQFAHLMRRAHLLLTDSGGIQEEASAIGKPVVVVRDTTERAESVEAGVSILAGRDRAAVAGAVERLLTDEATYQAMARATCPYGDGRAAERIVDVLVARHAADGRGRRETA
jgi:UDP-N-acetylglucosamine 2-epimerase (non-hydrolysing)